MLLLLPLTAIRPRLGFLLLALPSILYGIGWHRTAVNNKRNNYCCIHRKKTLLFCLVTNFRYKWALLCQGYEYYPRRIPSLGGLMPLGSTGGDLPGLFGQRRPEAKDSLPTHTKPPHHMGFCHFLRAEPPPPCACQC